MTEEKDTATKEDVKETEKVVEAEVFDNKHPEADF